MPVLTMATRTPTATRIVSSALFLKALHVDLRLTRNQTKAAAAGASTDGQTCEGGTGNIIDTGVCKNGKCNIEIPPNELSIVASADCE